MKLILLLSLALLAAALTTGCTQLGSHTIFYYPDGHKAFETDADATGLAVKVKGVGSLTALTHSHSSPITAHGNANAQVLQAAGDAVGVGARAFSGVP